MKLAIHQTKGIFTDSWVQYCRDQNVPFKMVNCYESDIISQLDDCDGLMWHSNLNDYKVALFARQLTFSLEKKGIKVFPDIHTSWHYNDKVGQKYLLEAIGAPLVPSYIFYSKQAAIEWLENTTFPKVFKLRIGASSSNVRLIKNNLKAKRLVKKAFGKGFSHINSFSRLQQRIYKFNLKRDISSVKLILGGLARLFIPTEVEIFSHKEKDYIYFQDFIPGNSCDFRIHVVGNYCWGFQRAVRKNDFRASGSGIQSFNLSEVPIEMIRSAFDMASKLNLQSVAFDFVINQKNQPGLVEMSYCFGFDDEDISYGYWTPDLVFHKAEFNPFNEMIINFISSLQRND
jgi:glutathione synthase/RimK-type ligase-like ATP-grasp enzyme